MAFDKRDSLWNVSFETFYDTYYNEIMSEKLISIWQLIDDVTKVIIALTASGSAISGWSLWSQGTFKIIWLVIAGISAVLAIVHTSLNVPSRVKTWSDVRASVSLLRIDLDTLRQRMAIDPAFPLDKLQTEYTELRTRFGQAVSDMPSDLLLTGRMRNHIQDDLDERIKDTIVVESQAGG